MPLLLTEQDVRDLASMEDAIAALESAHKSQGAGRAVNDPRRRLRAPHGAVAIMPAGDAETGFVGFKTAFYAAGAVHVLLYDMTERALAVAPQAGVDVDAPGVDRGGEGVAGGVEDGAAAGGHLGDADAGGGGLLDVALVAADLDDGEAGEEGGEGGEHGGGEQPVPPRQVVRSRGRALLP